MIHVKHFDIRLKGVSRETLETLPLDTLSLWTRGHCNF